MDYARLETATLNDVTADHCYGCHCTSCLHAARLSLSKLRAHLGPDIPLIKIRERSLRRHGVERPLGPAPSNARGETHASNGPTELYAPGLRAAGLRSAMRHTVPNNCLICSSRRVTVTFLGPHEKGGNLRHLFDKQER